MRIQFLGIGMVSTPAIPMGNDLLCVLLPGATDRTTIALQENY
jgi:hypothetical protein